MKCVAGNEKLDALIATHVWPDHNALARAIFVQQQHLDRITEIIMIKLVVADAVAAPVHRPDHKIEGRTGRAAVGKWRRQPARRNSMLAYKGDAYEPTRGVRLQLKELANFVCCQFFGHLFLLNIERRTANVQH